MWPGNLSGLVPIPEASRVSKEVVMNLWKYIEE